VENASWDKMALTIEQIRAAESDDALFDLLCSEIDRYLPEGLREEWSKYAPRLEKLPLGLRAMAGIYFLDVSMSFDDLAWHFGNQNDEREIAETLRGLQELEMAEIADCFEKMWNFMKPHMDALHDGIQNGKEFHKWLVEIGAQALADPMNKIIWKYCEDHSEHRLLTSWIEYARKYPERCVVAEAQA
jgi:hypothetical protein